MTIELHQQIDSLVSTFLDMWSGTALTSTSDFVSGDGAHTDALLSYCKNENIA